MRVAEVATLTMWISLLEPRGWTQVGGWEQRSWAERVRVGAILVVMLVVRGALVLLLLGHGGGAAHNALADTIA